MGSRQTQNSALKTRIRISKYSCSCPQQSQSRRRYKCVYLGIGGLYKGLGPLWARQVPYTIVKFVAFEWFVQFFYDNIFTKGKENYNKATQLSVTFASGYLAGIFCAIVSHPADTMVSKLYSKGSEEGSLMTKIGRIYG